MLQWTLHFPGNMGLTIWLHTSIANHCKKKKKKLGDVLTYTITLHIEKNADTIFLPFLQGKLASVFI